MTERGMLPAKFMKTENDKRLGKVYIMHSGSKTHFMNSETTVELMENLFVHAYKIQREKHQLAHDVLGMLQCDAFSGNFSFAAGEHLRREQAMLEMNALAPDKQPGGWSAKGQAADKINNHYKARVDIYTDLLLGFNHDLFSRPRFEDMNLGPTGALARKVTAREAVNSAIWAWESMDPRLFQWAFTSVGYVAEDRMKKT